MKKIDEMKAKLGTLKTDVQALLDDNKVKEAQDKMKEVRDLQAAIELQQEIEDMAKDDMQGRAKETQTKEAKDKTKENANIIRAMIKKVTGGKLTDAENELLLPTVSQPEGANGEGYILPQDIQTKIHEKMREFKSLRGVLGYIPAGALTGSFPTEAFDTVSELVDFADGTDGEDEKDIKFKNITFSLKEKAAFIKLSNTLLSMSDNDLIDYVVRIFAKKAVVTENKMSIAVLKTDKTAKALTSWRALKSSINKDLDPAVLNGTVIVTNQDGFDFLDSQLDATGRPILQPNPAKPTEMLFKGYPIEAFSNAMIPSVDGKAPIFYGNLSEAAKIVDWKGQVAFKASSEAGFWSNTTVARMIEFVDVVQSDSSDKCYIYGEIDTTMPPVDNSSTATEEPTE
ncbi:MAG: phage major capsid protein [Hominilimicola sp.]